MMAIISGAKSWVLLTSHYLFPALMQKVQTLPL